MPNLFDNLIAARRAPRELSEVLAQGPGVRIERIVSSGHVSPPGYWYDQEQDEWVCLLQGRARLAWENGQGQDLKVGDWLFIPAHARHRVEYTSKEPPCVWLAVHGRLVDTSTT